MPATCKWGPSLLPARVSRAVGTVPFAQAGWLRTKGTVPFARLASLACKRDGPRLSVACNRDSHHLSADRRRTRVCYNHVKQRMPFVRGRRLLNLTTSI